jgi:NNP family nitrate/nitrite transporter-like MFS transporter
MTQYFVMPAIFDSLMKNQHLTAHVAWRLSFIVPFIIITTIALAILFTAEDAPTGKWAERHHVGEPLNALASSTNSVHKALEHTEKQDNVNIEANQQPSAFEIAKGEVIVDPTFKEAMGVLFSLQTLALAAQYACSFGKQAPSPFMTQTYHSRW